MVSLAGWGSSASAPGGQCQLDGLCSGDCGMTQSLPSRGRCRSGPVWALLGQASDKPTGPNGVVCGLSGPGGVGPTICCPHVATLSTAGRSEGSLHFHSLPPTQGFTSLGQARATGLDQGEINLQPSPPLCFPGDP